VDIYYPVT